MISPNEGQSLAHPFFWSNKMFNNVRSLRILCVLLLVVGVTGAQAQLLQPEMPEMPEPEARLTQPGLVLQPIALGSEFEDKPIPEGAVIRHRVPELPLIIDGSFFTPEQIRFFDGQPLHFYADEATMAEGVLYGFTSRAGLREFLVAGHRLPADRETSDQPLRTVTGKAMTGGTGVVIFYENSNWGGSFFWVPVGYTATFGSSWWDNKISSTLLQTSPVSRVVLWDFSSCTGTSLTLGTTFSVTQSSIHNSFNFGDRAACVQVF